MSLSNDHWPLSQYILLIGAFKATKPNGEPSNPQVAMQFIKEANAEFKFAVPDSREGKKSAWIGSDSDTLLKGPVFGIRWDHRPKNCKSFVFGSMDPECSSKSDCACDFALAPDNQASCISRNQIAIGLYPQQHARKTATVKLTCLNGPVWISRPSQKDQTNKTEQYSLPRGKTEPVDSCIRVCLTTLEFQVWIPGLTKAEAKERNSLASAFERECASLMPARLPNITGAMDTVCDNVRNVATKRLCIYESRNPPHNTLDKPFFVIRYGGEKKWAWQPYRTEEETKESLAQKEKTIHSMWETSVKIGIHVSTLSRI
ncbi:hypothetical protein F5Y06DRAFT_109267 [Hypoxylon sp. FL0890]|nr:hypothetical protein F5Y06DRAFT_109267 [Hypoxylon sp. FL0890]